MNIIFEVKNQQICRIDGNTVIANSRNYLYAKFTFITSEWTGTKTAIFQYENEQAYSQILDDNDMCKVPWEVIQSGAFKVSVFCGDLVTTNTAVVMVGKSGYTEATQPKEPTPDVYTQIIQMLDELKANGMDSETVNAAIMKYMEENPIETLSEDDVNNIIDNAGLAKASDIPSVDGLASETFVTEAITNDETHVKTSEFDSLVNTNLQLETRIAKLETRIAELEESNTSTDDSGNNLTDGTENETGSNGSDDTSGDDTSGDATTEEVLPEGCMWIEQGSWDYEGNKVDSTTRVRIDSFVDISEILGSTVSIDVKAADGSDVHFLARMHNESGGTYVNANHASGTGFVTSTASVTSNKWYTRFTIIMTADEDETVDATPSQFDGVIVTVKQGSSVYKTITLKAHAS